MRRPDPFRQLLVKALASSEVSSRFSPPRFFEKWFRDSGSAYLFLFRKNLAVTNVQFAELLALLRVHTRHSSRRDRSPDLQFLSVSEFNAGIRGVVVDAFGRAGRSSANRNAFVAELYAELFRRSVVVDSFYGSCAVFAPPHLRIDVAAICAESGYVHSCGLNVFTRKTSKCTKKVFFAAVRRHLERRRQTKRLFFSVYAHEDFTRFDRAEQEELHHGLDDVKIHVEKFYMGKDRLVDVLTEMRRKFRRELQIPDPGDFRTKHRQARQQKNIDLRRTLWLIAERGIDPGTLTPSAERYYICYDQHHVNENPFYLFDEDKPAWLTHTTLPHTLTAAMINITRPAWPHGRRVVISDPFAGTGTTALEACKVSRVALRCCDLEPSAGLMLADNAVFFGSSIKDLQINILDLLFAGRVAALGAGRGMSRHESEMAKAYADVQTLLGSIKRQRGSADRLSVHGAVLRTLEGWQLRKRMLFYVGLRTLGRHLAAFDRRSEDWGGAYRLEAKKLARRVKKLRDLMLRTETGRSQGRGIIWTTQGRYSQGWSINWRRFRARFGRRWASEVVKHEDARRIPPGCCDVIVTDPPYGFNTGEGPRDLAALYAKAIECFVSALRPDGQIVIALPETSYTGKQTLLFAHKEVVIQQLLEAAGRARKEIVSPSPNVPGPSRVFRAPFYWESARALRRTIIHFRIKGPQA